MINTSKSNQGQALMMVVLVMFVGLTMVMIAFMNSMASLRLVSVEEQSERSFNVSEAGIEKLLMEDNLTEGAGTQPVLDGITAKTFTTGQKNYSYELKNNDSGEIQLGVTSLATQVKLYWTKVSDTNENPSDNCKRAGMVVEKWNKTNNVARFVYQPLGCNTNLPAGEQTFTWDFATNSLDPTYRSTATISVDKDQDVMLRIRPIYNKATVYALGIDSLGTPKDLPIQQHQISSQAQVPETGETRALEVVRTVPQLPSIFDYVLFSGESGIEK